MTDIRELYLNQDAIGLADLVQRGDVSPTELLETAIGLAERHNDRLNCVVVEAFDLARASIDNLPAGPLRGVPFLIKDLYAAIAGLRMTNGSQLYRDYVADHDSVSVERYRAAGLVIFGRTASPEFGLTTSTESIVHGSTRNPWNPAHTSGGSSGGSFFGGGCGHRARRSRQRRRRLDSHPRVLLRPGRPQADARANPDGAGHR